MNNNDRVMRSTTPANYFLQNYYFPELTEIKSNLNNLHYFDLNTPWSATM